MFRNMLAIAVLLTLVFGKAEGQSAPAYKVEIKATLNGDTTAVVREDVRDWTTQNLPKTTESRLARKNVKIILTVRVVDDETIYDLATAKASVRWEAVGIDGTVLAGGAVNNLASTGLNSRAARSLALSRSLDRLATEMSTFISQ